MSRGFHECNCGSGKHAPWRYDARGIELMRACDACWQDKSRRYRPYVLSDPSYWADEDIEPDPGSDDPGCVHEFAYSGENYGGDEAGEGRCYCVYCGADGDA